MATIKLPEGGCKDITDKSEIEEAIMNSNEAKFRQSHHRPFFHDPLKREFGFKGLTPQASRVLAGVYECNETIPEAEQQLLEALAMPSTIRTSGTQSMDTSLDSYRSFWRKAKEATSSYPGAISFSTMKAGASSDLISAIECNMTRIPLRTGYSLRRWKKCMDVMILKKSRITSLNSHHTVCLFATDCNYAFKHIGRELMRHGNQQSSHLRHY
jgi:hypothetical protein